VNDLEKPDADCKICGARQWDLLYCGPVRAGKFGEVTSKPQAVWKCRGCEAGFLEGFTLDYETGEYRRLVEGEDSIDHFYQIHDSEQLEKINVVGTGNLRKKIIADIGCGAGSFLDLIKGYSSATIAIEPQQNYHPALRDKGHRVYSYCEDLLQEWRKKIDLIVCFSVIEHLDDPVSLMSQARGLVNSHGRVLISTPNGNDWLLNLLPDAYSRFFYRTAHKWYFREESLKKLAQIAGFSKAAVRYVHRFDFSNFLLWLRDERPTGLGKIQIPASLNEHFSRALEEAGTADYMYAWLEP
jgi:2-polyprenyl-3-methyl-5-hydroxy-6-metoxy-1,4-benzoquinol methylase